MFCIWIYGVGIGQLIGKKENDGFNKSREKETTPYLSL
jgi:hypothetical protein